MEEVSSKIIVNQIVGNQAKDCGDRGSEREIKPLESICKESTSLLSEDDSNMSGEYTGRRRVNITSTHKA